MLQSWVRLQAAEAAVETPDVVEVIPQGQTNPPALSADEVLEDEVVKWEEEEGKEEDEEEDPDPPVVVRVVDEVVAEWVAVSSGLVVDRVVEVLVEPPLPHHPLRSRLP